MEDQRIREFCKDFVGEDFYKQLSLKKATQITLFEKICLWFVKEQFSKDPIENTVLVFKTFRGKIYILDHFHVPPEGYRCRHSLIYTARAHGKKNLIENNSFFQ